MARVFSTSAEISAAKALIAEGDRSAAATVDVFHDGDLVPECPEVAGPVALAQRIARRLKTSNGFFPWWPNEGLNISDYLLSRTPTWQIENQVKEEVKRDQAVVDAVVVATLSEDKRDLLVKIFVTSVFGPLELTMTANESSARLLDIRRAA
jgi:hypothetical protein